MNRPPDTSEAVVTVGEGRGFIVETMGSRFVITAAHCLPHLPPGCPASYAEERTYANLLGPLNAPPTVWAECVFVDPVADVAVLGGPDSQAMSKQADAYERFVGERPTLFVGALSDWPAKDDEQTGMVSAGVGWVLSLADGWKQYEIQVFRSASIARTFVCSQVEIEGGMSGSPVIDARGEAVGVISTGGEGGVPDPGPPLDPVLAKTLPVWLIEQLQEAKDYYWNTQRGV